MAANIRFWERDRDRCRSMRVVAHTAVELIGQYRTFFQSARPLRGRALRNRLPHRVRLPTRMSQRREVIHYIRLFRVDCPHSRSRLPYRIPGKKYPPYVITSPCDIVATPSTPAFQAAPFVVPPSVPRANYGTSRIYRGTADRVTGNPYMDTWSWSAISFLLQLVQIDRMFVVQPINAAVIAGFVLLTPCISHSTSASGDCVIFSKSIIF